MQLMVAAPVMLAEPGGEQPGCGAGHQPPPCGHMHTPSLPVLGCKPKNPILKPAPLCVAGAVSGSGSIPMAPHSPGDGHPAPAADHSISTVMMCSHESHLLIGGCHFRGKATSKLLVSLLACP